jgi:hypothetical protein
MCVCVCVCVCQWMITKPKSNLSKWSEFLSFVFCFDGMRARAWDREVTCESCIWVRWWAKGESKESCGKTRRFSLFVKFPFFFCESRQNEEWKWWSWEEYTMRCRFDHFHHHLISAWFGPSQKSKLTEIWKSAKETSKPILFFSFFLIVRLELLCIYDEMFGNVSVFPDFCFFVVSFFELCIQICVWIVRW